jgi:hypothetical protein
VLKVDNVKVSPLVLAAGAGPVAAKMTSSATTSFANGAATKTIWDAVTFDKTSGVASTANSRMNILVSGDYQVQMNMFFSSATASASGAIQVLAYVNGVSTANLGSTAVVNGSTSYRDVNASGILPNLKAGDYVEIYVSQDSGVSLSSLGAINQFTINKIVDASAVGAGAVIAVRAEKSGTQSLTTATETTITSWTETQDSTSSFDASTGVFTAPVAGTYKIDGVIAIGSNATGFRYAAVFKNGAIYNYGPGTAPPASNDSGAVFTAQVPMIAGETLSVKAYQNSGGSLNVSAGTATSLNISKLATDAVSVAFAPPTVQRFTSGSGTYTTPAGVKYIRVKMAGGGGGGGSSGSALRSSGNSGASSTFGSSLLTADAGLGGGSTSNIGGSGGLGTVNSPAISMGGSLATRSANGSGGVYSSTTIKAPGGLGGDTVLFGGGGKTGYTSPANGTNNTGGGGQGGIMDGVGTGVIGISGPGGGGGGSVDAIIPAPGATYAYSVGTGGSGGAAGTNGVAGASGGDGIIIVEEYYQ